MLELGIFKAFTLVLLRLTGLFVSAPLFSSRDIPPTVKVGLGLVTALVVFPLVPVGELPYDLGGYAAFAAAELGVGLTLGFASSMFFSAFQLAGQHVGQQMGIAMADVVDPFSEAEVPVVGQFQFFLAVAVYVTIGAHRWLLATVAGSFRTVPLGGFRPTPALVDALVGSFGNILVLSFQIAAPVLVALFLSTVALGFVARAVPQMNVLILSFPLQIGLGLGVMIWTLPAVAGFALIACEGMAADLGRVVGMMAHG